MTVPFEYVHATLELERFLRDALDNAALTTTNQAYTMTQGVLQAFRRRLEPQQAVDFAQVLPPLLRALFVTDWDLSEPRRSFESVEVMTEEVKSLRREHNFAPDSSIRDVARALRKHVNNEALDRVLAKLPPGAAEFWRA